MFTGLDPIKFVSIKNESMHIASGSKKSLLLAALLLLLGWGTVRAQLIWPGDVNNNGEVNVVDLLYLGVAFGETGPVRPGATTDFVGQAAGPLWAQNFPNGINYAYADADGNGIVDENDLDDAIDDNYGLQHGVVTGDGYVSAAPGTGPALRLVPTVGVVATGATIDIDLVLGTAGAPITDFYGIALRLSYQTAKGSDFDGLEYEAADAPWYDPTETTSLNYYFEDDDAGQAALAITRTDQLTASGEGSLGRFSVVIEDIIALETVDTLIVSIDSVLLITDDLTPRGVASTQTRVIVADDPGSVTATRDHREQRPKPVLRVRPNPVRSSFQVFGPADISGWQLIDPAGRSYPLTPGRVAAGWYSLKLPPRLPPGVYFLRARTAHGILQEKIFFISHP